MKINKSRSKSSILKLLLPIFFVLFFLPFSLSATELPTPPAGYQWQELKEIKAFFLAPKGWFYKAEYTKGTQVYFITKEDISTQGSFDTGLTINVMKNDSSFNAVEYAKAFISQMTKTNETLKAWPVEVGAIKGLGCRIKLIKPPKGEIIIGHYLALGNSVTKTLYILFFESPETLGEDAWAKGEVILKLFGLDDEI